MNPPSVPSVKSVVKTQRPFCSPDCFFNLVTEFGQVVAALLPERLTAAQYKTLFAILPRAACNCPALAARWEYSAVIATPDWAGAQLRRVPMLPPKNSIPLCFL